MRLQKPNVAHVNTALPVALPRNGAISESCAGPLPAASPARRLRTYRPAHRGPLVPVLGAAAPTGD